jgi:hypothetical protein
MHYSDWKMISSIGLILGALSLIGGIFAYVYEEQTRLWVVHPFREYTAPLVIFGVVLLVVGYVAGVRGKEARRLAEERPVAGVVYCSSCGTRNLQDSVYCKKCGKKLSTG